MPKKAPPALTGRRGCWCCCCVELFFFAFRWSESEEVSIKPYISQISTYKTGSTACVSFGKIIEAKYIVDYKSLRLPIHSCEVILGDGEVIQ